MIAILDFGSQYTQLIARRVREANVYCEVLHYKTNPEQLKEAKGIIISGSPKSVSSDGSPKPDPKIFELDKPILGLCYGMQLMGEMLGGKVSKGFSGEYGRTPAKIDDKSPIFAGIQKELIVWMSHGDLIEVMPKGFENIAKSEFCPIAAMQDKNRKLFGLQFHPEVFHTEQGSLILENFLFGLCHEDPSWKMSAFARDEIEKIRSKVGTDHVIVGVSGGVDSVTTSVLLHKAIGNQLHAIFVDHGLLRANEREEVETALKNIGLDLIVIDAQKQFLEGLKGITDPEEKRMTIGRLFIEVFEEAAKSIQGAKYLAQGTLYPDVIESSGGVSGLADKIKSHHNVGGLPEKFNLKVIEPMRMLFKDEVRNLGRELGIPKHLVERQPFPGPGLAIRIIGEITPKRLEILKCADLIVREEIKDSDQFFAVLLPIQAVGVKGDERSYGLVCAIRAVNTTDFMTAEWSKIPYTTLDRIATRITCEVKEIGRVVYDITNKPPGTIEWE